MHDHRTATATINVDAAELEAAVRTVEEMFLLMGDCDLSHSEGDEDDLRGRCGQTLAWLFGQANLAACGSGGDMDNLPYDSGDVLAAMNGDLTRSTTDA
jgi:hypothetical protein